MCYFVLKQEEGWLIGVKDSTGEKKMFPANFTRPLWEPHCRKRKEITKRPSILKFSFWILVILFYVFMSLYVYSNEIWCRSMPDRPNRAATTSILMAFLFYKLNTALKFINIYFFYAPCTSSLINTIWSVLIIMNLTDWEIVTNLMVHIKLYF